MPYKLVMAKSHTKTLAKECGLCTKNYINLTNPNEITQFTSHTWKEISTEEYAVLYLRNYTIWEERVGPMYRGEGL